MDYFEENQEKSVGAFIRYWNAYKGSHERPGTLDWWRGYLFSEEFQNIRFHPQVVHLLAGERAWRCLRHDFFHKDYMTDEMKGLLWDAYGFQGDDQAAYQGACQGEVHKLWRYLHPRRIRRRMKKRTKRLIRGAAIVLILLFCIWGACMANDGKMLAPVAIALLYYARTLFGDARE